MWIGARFPVPIAAVLEWPGRPLQREEVLAAVRAALVAQGAAPDCDVEIPGFTPPIVPLSGVSAPVVTQLDFDRDLGRFTAMLSVTGEGMRADLRAAQRRGRRCHRSARRRHASVGRYDHLDRTMCGWRGFMWPRVHAEVARDPAMVIGMQLRQQVQAGVPIPLSEPDATDADHSRRPGADAAPDRRTVGWRGRGSRWSPAPPAIESASVTCRRRRCSRPRWSGPGRVRVMPGTSPITTQARIRHHPGARRLIMSPRWAVIVVCGVAVSGCGTCSDCRKSAGRRR